MVMKKDLTEFGFDIKLPQKDWMSKVVCNAIGDMHHIPLVGKELPSILVESKDNLLELTTTQILVQSPLASIQIFMGCPR